MARQRKQHKVTEKEAARLLVGALQDSIKAFVEGDVKAMWKARLQYDIAMVMLLHVGRR